MLLSQHLGYEGMRDVGGREERKTETWDAKI